MSLIVKIFLIEDWSKEPTQIRRFAWDTGLKFPELCEKVLNLYPNLIGCDLVLKWKDEEGDWIDISSDTELMDAAKACEGHLLKLWVSTEKKPSELKEPWVDWQREWCHRGSRGGRGCRGKGIPSWKEHKMTHWGYVCDACDGPIVGCRYNCRECPNYDLCQDCFDCKKHAEHSLVEIRFPKRGRRGCSREIEKEFLESVGNGVAELLAPLNINVDVEVQEPTQPTEEAAAEYKQEPEVELKPEPVPTAPSGPVQPNPLLSQPPAQFPPSEVMPLFYMDPNTFGHFPPMPHYGPPMHPHPHPHPHPHSFPFYPQQQPIPPQSVAKEFVYIPEEMSVEQKKAMTTLHEMGFDISNSKLVEGVRRNGENVHATIEEMLKK